MYWMLRNNNLPRPKFLKENDRLAALYVEKQSEHIVRDLYSLDGPLFRSMEVEYSKRDDYEQDAYFIIKAALRSFKPSRGPFIPWLRKYITNWKRDARVAKKGFCCLSDDMVTTQQEHIDYYLWNSIKKRLSDDEWKFINLRYLENLKIEDVGKELGLGVKATDSLKSRTFKKFENLKHVILEA